MWFMRSGKWVPFFCTVIYDAIKWLDKTEIFWCTHDQQLEWLLNVDRSLLTLEKEARCFCQLFMYFVIDKDCLMIWLLNMLFLHIFLLIECKCSSLVLAYMISFCLTQLFIRPQEVQLWGATGIWARPFPLFYLHVAPWCIPQPLQTRFPFLCRWYMALHFHWADTCHRPVKLENANEKWCHLTSFLSWIRGKKYQMIKRIRFDLCEKWEIKSKTMEGGKPD